MARTEPFDKYPEEYEDWFNERKYVYESEIEAVRHFIPQGRSGFEIGIGTGRFVLPFGIQEGLEPSYPMGRLAAQKGLRIFKGIAEKIPLMNDTYDFALMVTTICFLDNIKESFRETRRILKPGGSFIIGLVDKDSPLGRTYQKLKEQNRFYRYATFYSAEEVIKCLEENGFKTIEAVQTVFGNPDSVKVIQNFKEGYGEGGFVVIKGEK